MCFASVLPHAVCFVLYSSLSKTGFLPREEGQNLLFPYTSMRVHTAFLSESANVQPTSHRQSANLVKGRMVNSHSFRTVPVCQTEENKTSTPADFLCTGDGIGAGDDGVEVGYRNR